MQYVKAVVATYQQMMNTKYKTSSDKDETFGTVGVPNRQFFVTLEKMGMVPILNFLRQLSLIPTECTCKCGHPMVESDTNNVSDGSTWKCRKKTNGKICYASKSVRANSWFSRSKLPFGEILILLYELLNHTKDEFLIKERSFSSHTIAYWRDDIKKVLVGYMETNSEKIGGPDKMIEVFEVLVGKKHRKSGFPIDGQWFFVGMDCSTGQFFIEEVPDRSVDMLIIIMKQWIYPGSTITSECWNAPSRLGIDAWNKLSTDLSLTFINPDKELDCKGNSVWKYIKASMPEYSKHRSSLKEILAEFIFKKSCTYGNIDRFLKFAEILSQIKWEELTVKSEELEQ